MSAKAILFGEIKKVAGGKSGIELNCVNMKLEGGSIKEIFKLVQNETKVRIEVEPFQEEMFDDPPGDTSDDDGELFDE